MVTSAAGGGGAMVVVVVVISLLRDPEGVLYMLASVREVGWMPGNVAQAIAFFSTEALVEIEVDQP